MGLGLLTSVRGAIRWPSRFWKHYCLSFQSLSVVRRIKIASFWFAIICPLILCVSTYVTVNLLARWLRSTRISKQYSLDVWDARYAVTVKIFLLKCVCSNHVHSQCDRFHFTGLFARLKMRETMPQLLGREICKTLGLSPVQAQWTCSALRDVHCVGFCLVLCYGAEVVPSYPDFTQHCPVWNGRWATVGRKVRAREKKSRMTTKKWEHDL